MNILTLDQLRGRTYDYLIVGAGISGAVFAERASELGYECLVVDRRNHIAGNCHIEQTNGIDVHKYGAHIFHTNDERVKAYIDDFILLSNYKHQVLAIGVDDHLYQMPFNLMTFSQLAHEQLSVPMLEDYLATQQTKFENPQNLEEQAIRNVGKDAYETLIKKYTEKQWGKKCTELPASIIKRIPVRLNYDTTYFSNAKYQGIPANGYDDFVEQLLDNCDVVLNVDYLKERSFLDSLLHSSANIVYTGALDELFDYQLGALEYRSISFDDEWHETPNVQGTSVVNYCNDNTYTRCIEHRHFMSDCKAKTSLLSFEQSETFIPKSGMEPSYPIGDERNLLLHAKYLELLRETMPNIIPLGRLAMYKYYDMDAAILAALESTDKEL
jgi:UDP-galactopyranose mutase